MLIMASTSRNGDKISIALLENYGEAIISQAYSLLDKIGKLTLNVELTSGLKRRSLRFIV